jgi:hypothetical protein
MEDLSNEELQNAIANYEGWAIQAQQLADSELLRLCDDRHYYNSKAGNYRAKAELHRNELERRSNVA